VVRVHGSELVAVHRAPELSVDELGELVAAHRAPELSGGEHAVAVSAVGLRLMQDTVLRQHVVVDVLWLCRVEESPRRIPASWQPLSVRK